MGTLRKVGEWPDLVGRCLHPEHNPPTHIVLEPGIYEHECPGCFKVTRISVPPRLNCAQGASKLA